MAEEGWEVGQESGVALGRSQGRDGQSRAGPGQSRGPGRLMALPMDSCRHGWGRDLCRAGAGWLYFVTDSAWPCESDPESDPVTENLACFVTVTVSGLLWECVLVAD